MPTICPVILAGGQGTRLWPLSTPERPKQFLPLPGLPSLFQQTLQRIKHADFMPPIVVCLAQHQHLIEQELQRANITATAILTEAKPRNTAPAIALASNWIAEQLPAGIFALILPADQYLEPTNKLHQAILSATRQAPDNLNLFGLSPSLPSSQFGYIKTNGQHTVTGFEEKPTPERAEQLINEHHAYWNSGIFLANNIQLQSWLQQYQDNLDNQPFDKAIVEKISEQGPSQDLPLHLTPLHCQWQDMGSWQAWYDLAQAKHYPSTQRRWGNYAILLEEPGHKVKLLTLAPGKFISLQKHQHRSEHWVIMAGEAEVTLGQHKHQLAPRHEITVPAGEWHQLTNIGTEELKVIETQVGDYLEEDDIIRL